MLLQEPPVSTEDDSPVGCWRKLVSEATSLQERGCSPESVPSNTRWAAVSLLANPHLPLLIAPSELPIPLAGVGEAEIILTLVEFAAEPAKAANEIGGEATGIVDSECDRFAAVGDLWISEALQH